MLIWFSFLALIAQIPDASWVNVLFAYGPMGLIIVWFITRGEKLGNRVSDKLDLLTRAILVDLLSRDGLGPQSRRMAQDLLDESSDKPKR